MISPAKAIIAGALVFAIGGAFLIAQPFDQQGGIVPGAATDTMRPATFTAEGGRIGKTHLNPLTLGDGVLFGRDEIQLTVEATDPRAAGTFTYDLNTETYQDATVHSGTVTIENDGGRWTGTFTGYQDSEGATNFHARLTGHDAYEGGTMLLDDFCCKRSGKDLISGVIVPGDLPSDK
jgi:hypothetical protein